MRVVSVVGARPQFVKLAPVAHAFSRAGVDHAIIHTGQHYDPMLSEVFFEELGIPAPDVHLGIGSGSHGHQTGRMLEALDDAIPGLAPDWVLVYGDTNSTLAAALCAVKTHLPVAHLEAGLRSFDRAMPEEINRVLTDHAADLLLAPTSVAAEHLADEGLGARTMVVGDVMTDVLLDTRDAVAGAPSPLARELGVEPGAYSVATIHRPQNTDDPARLRRVLGSLAAVGHPVVLLAHPRLVARCAEYGIPLLPSPEDPGVCGPSPLDGGGCLLVHRPLGYRELVASVLAARGVITDSGGLQKEAFLLRVPATTVRPTTEWVETVDLGWNVLVGPGPDLVSAATRPRPEDTGAAPYGDGHTADRVARVLAERAG
ncbi:UDP-N-acetyl glucosamine 2-epimerase [Schaalia naturae]|uniref:UDP-N-acetyl glucosamine 2-epimerase n=1 Tax=Schaalia naturae TaxID=635203 RepID=A0ABW2SN66_9ACTO